MWLHSVIGLWSRPLFLFLTCTWAWPMHMGGTVKERETLLTGTEKQAGDRGPGRFDEERGREGGAWEERAPGRGQGGHILQRECPWVPACKTLLSLGIRDGGNLTLVSVSYSSLLCVFEGALCQLC